MPFEKSVLVPLGADETFALITQPDRLRRWKAITARVDLRAGGDYRWTIIPGHSACGTFTEVEPGRRVVFTWGWEGDTALPPGASTVTITLEPAEGGTIVRLVHDGLTGEQAAMHGEGWTHYLGRLAEAGTRGDAGADEWAAVPQDPDAIAAAEATLAVCQLVLRGVAEADYDRATVCPEFSVAQLADHLIGSVTFVGGAAGAEFPPAAATALEPRLAAAAQPALEAWNGRGLDGTVKVGSGEMPAGAALGILSVEFLVHAWDLARATGQHVTVPEGLAAHVLHVAGQIITPEVRSGGNFADAVPVGPDAGVMDRLIAFTGRYVPVGGTSST
ncbi:MAG TPA: TIGR03086 family metal-binding protein [Streptosporangiaceae bacterium]|nr:TIGR03086 family metal-binding protein [Streptosporangiaceae bacterium]